MLDEATAHDYSRLCLMGGIFIPNQWPSRRMSKNTPWNNAHTLTPMESHDYQKNRSKNTHFSTALKAHELHTS